MDGIDNGYWAIAAWAMDFCRRVEEFGTLRKLLLRSILGKFAAREYVGLRSVLNKYGHDTSIGYGLEKVAYHKEDWKWM